MKRVTKTVPTKTDIEFRRWCIEQAIKWPTHFGSPIAVGSYIQLQQVDVLDRAERIRKWVMKEV